MSERSVTGFTQGFICPWIEPGNLVAWLAEFAQHAPAFETGNLRFQAQQDRTIRPFLPHWDSKVGAKHKDVLALRQTLADVYQNALGQPFDPSRRPAEPLDIGGTIDVVAALALGISAASDPVGAELPALEGARVAAFRGELSDLPESVSRVMRRSRWPALSVFDMANHQLLALVDLSDDADEGATLDGLRAGAEGAFEVLAPQATAAGVVWIEDTRRLNPGALGRVAEMLAGLRALGQLPEHHDLMILPGTNGDLHFAAVPVERNATEVDVLGSQADPETELSVTALRPVAAKSSLKALQEKITSPRFPVGYRVSLRDLPDRMRSEADVEKLREEIVEREAEIELIRALAAPQMRLLRFSDAQLPAMVDALRRLPSKILQDAGLRYAAGHAAGRAEPAHFLLYDPAKIAIEGHLREFFWRGKTEDRPIQYWLDPHAAQAMDRENSTHTLVFTPANQRLFPAIDGFGGNLDQTLRLVLGNLFADASPVLEAQGARPVFLFSPPGQAGADMDVELLDERWFEPVHLSLRWINDYMIVRSPRLADRTTLSQLAEDLYEGLTAEELRREAAERTEGLRADWKAAEAELQGEIDGALQHIVEEMRAAKDRLQLGRAYLEDAKTRIAELDGQISVARQQVTKASEGSAEIHAMTPSLIEGRFAMVADLITELDLGNQAMVDAEQKVLAQVREIEALEEKLRLL